MKPSDVFPLLGDTAQAMGGVYGSVMRTHIEAAGFDLQSPQWYIMLVSRDFEPEYTSAARFVERTPYTAPHIWEENLAVLAGRGLLESVGGGDYRITEAGHAAVKPANDTLESTLRGVEPLPAADLERIAHLLRRLVEAAVAAPEPSAKPHLDYNRNSDPGPDGPILLRILQYLADLGAFRDDAHLSTWQPAGISGPAWEALTFVWRGAASTAAQLAETLANRGLTEDDYHAVLQDLAARGWIEPHADGYQITEAGGSVRREAENQTDQIYYAAWDALTAEEVDELGHRLAELRDRLREPVQS